MTEDWRGARMRALEGELADLTDAARLLVEQRAELQAEVTRLNAVMEGLEREFVDVVNQRDEMKSRHDFTVEANKLLAAKLERREARVLELERWASRVAWVLQAWSRRLGQATTVDKVLSAGTWVAGELMRLGGPGKSAEGGQEAP